MEFSAALSKPTKTEWSELRLTKCAQQAASPLSAKPFGFVDSKKGRPQAAFCVVQMYWSCSW